MVRTRNVYDDSMQLGPFSGAEFVIMLVAMLPWLVGIAAVILAITYLRRSAHAHERSAAAQERIADALERERGVG